MFDPAVDLDLSRNEGRTRGSELLAAVADPDRAISRYPDTSAVRARLADLHGLGPDHVLVTAGGDDALNRCFLALVGTGRRAVTTYPTFEMIPRYAEQRGVELVEVPWWTGPFPVDEVLGSVASDIDALFLVSPNNPTGAALTETDLKRVAEVFPFVVLDAAYAEFGDVDLTAAALELGNVTVIRTLSKAYGLAGLRVGYLLAKPATVARVGAFGSPYPVSALSAAVAETRLGLPESETTGFVDRITRERNDLFAILGDLGTRPYPSQGNFILTECDNAGWVVDASRSLGVALRHFPSRAGMEDMVRITLPGDEPDFDRLVSALSAVMAPEAIIFDLDGVIADVSRSQTIAIIETAQSYGVIVSPSDVELAKAGGSANNDWELARRLCAQNGVDADLDGLTERYERLYQGEDGISGLKQHEQAVVGPERWRDWAVRLPLGIVTGRPRRDAEEFLTRFGLLDMVSALVTMEDAPLKPDPAPVRRVLELLGVSHAWMLGDTPDDLQAARAAGVVPIGVVAPGDDVSRAREVLRSAAHILERTTDLEGLFS
jgi:histidinol-phosphate aminotransferase